MSHPLHRVCRGCVRSSFAPPCRHRSGASRVVTVCFRPTSKKKKKRDSRFVCCFFFFPPYAKRHSGEDFHPNLWGTCSVLPGLFNTTPDPFWGGSKLRRTRLFSVHCRSPVRDFVSRSQRIFPEIDFRANFQADFREWLRIP